MPLTRGQKRCVETLDKAIAVAAGAGSGKTHTLTQRIVHAFNTGYVDDISQVMAITFTRKAAFELKSRIKGALRSQGRIEQALKVDNAWITTIHGACARILRAHALELQIDPSFQILEESAERDLRAEAIEEVLAEAAASGTETALVFAEFRVQKQGEFDSTNVQDMLTTLMHIISSHPGGLQDLLLPPKGPTPQDCLRALMEEAEEFMPLASSAKSTSKSKDEWIEDTNEALQMAQEALVAGELEGRVGSSKALVLMDEFPVPPANFGPKDFRKEAKNHKKRYEELGQTARLAWAEPVFSELMSLAEKAAGRYQELKAADGWLDNDDLLVLASRALDTHPAIAREYSNAFRLVMVDEFQDTSQMQVDMVKRLSGSASERLCTVGDAQQSIYRFRGADVQVYRRHVKSLEAQDASSIMRLADNFRSHADILTFLDAVFSQASMFGSDFMSLRHGRDESLVTHPYKGEARIKINLVTRKSRGGSLRVDQRRAEAALIAKDFARLRSLGHDAGEMVLLLGTMGNAEIYAQALRNEGFSCVVAQGSVFNKTTESANVLSLARTLVNPLDEPELFATLTSAIFCLPADDLVKLCSKQVEGAKAQDSETSPAVTKVKFGRAFLALMNEYEAHPEISPRLRRAAEVMQRACADIGKRPLSTLLMDVMVESGYLSRLEKEGAQGQAAAANTYKAIRFIAEIEKNTDLGPAGVVERFSGDLAVMKEAPGALSAAEDGFVRIMSIHSSKGLEFPIVAIAEMREGKPSTSKLLSSQIKDKTYLSLDAGRSLDPFKEKSILSPLSARKLRDVISEKELDESEAVEDYLSKAQTPLAWRLGIAVNEFLGEYEEAKRLLYVAITRAREAVILSIPVTLKKDSGASTSELMHAVQTAVCEADDFFSKPLYTIGRNDSCLVATETLHLDAASVDEDDVSEDTQAIDENDIEPAESEDEQMFFLATDQDGLSSSDELYAYKPLRRDVFSYSSIADAAKTTGIIRNLAKQFVQDMPVDAFDEEEDDIAPMLSND
ncbi:MAG: UvrD-helicase domain-containing protein, partial [Eggerthellaceae bacterium]